MKVDNNEININRYINGELQGKELIAFEALLQQDKALQEKINFHKDVDTILYEKMAPIKTFEKEEAKLKPLLNDLGKEFFLDNQKEEFESVKSNSKLETKPKSGIVKRLLPFAALAAAAAVLLFVIAPWKSNLSGTELANNNFTPFDLGAVMDFNDSPTLFDEAKKEYYNKNYLASLPLLNQYLETNPNSPKALLAKGCSEYELAKLEEAIHSFKLAAGHSSFKAIAHWYLALTYLKKEDNEVAKTVLSKIKRGEENYEAAQKLLRQVD